MSSATDLHAVVEAFAAQLEHLELTGDDQEAYSTVLCRLEDQADHDEPNWIIVEECRAYLDRFNIKAA
ncbi:MAG TPA: hypothetical protein VKR52_00480 [Terracidiphilus sp.]|nr:hypothetical protein [Terracidiphilus sp.]